MLTQPCDTATAPDRRERAATRIGTRPVTFFMPYPCHTGGQRAAFHVLMRSPGPTEVKLFAQYPQRKNEESSVHLTPKPVFFPLYSATVQWVPEFFLSPENCYKNLIPQEQALANFFCKGPVSILGFLSHMVS